MTYEIPIERDIPVPPRQRHGSYSSKYPTKHLEVGDSFAVEVPYDKDAKAFSKTVASAVYSYSKRKNLDWSFSVRILHEQGREVVRVWRTN